MKTIASLLTSAAIAAAALAPVPAHAMLATLVSCDMGTSVSGLPVWIGTYNVNGQTFTRSFASYCPTTLNVY